MHDDHSTKFVGTITARAATTVSACNERLTDPARLAALRRTGLFGTPAEEAYDRLAQLAARILGVPLTLVSLVSDEKQFFKAGVGLPEFYEKNREIPIDDSIYRYTLHGESIIAHDVSASELLQFHPTTKPWNIGAFLAIPMTTKEGHVLGAFCAVSTQPRVWSADDVYVMEQLASSVMREIHLQEQVAELEVERGLREQFVATLSHDLRTPLNIAKMASQLLVDETTNHEERSKLARMVDTNMDRADKMITDLLDVTRIKAGGQMHLELEAGSLEAIVAANVETLSSLYGARLAMRIAHPCQGRWDRSALARILDNLVANAFKYGERDRDVIVSVREEDNHALIEVVNFGNPIPPEKLESLFGLYQRSQSAVDSSQKGWGIGLTLVRGLVEAHGGHMSARSSSEDGTIFTARFPLP